MLLPCGRVVDALVTLAKMIIIELIVGPLRQSLLLSGFCLHPFLR